MSTEFTQCSWRYPRTEDIDIIRVRVSQSSNHPVAQAGRESAVISIDEHLPIPGPSYYVRRHNNMLL